MNGNGSANQIGRYDALMASVEEQLRGTTSVSSHVHNANAFYRRAQFAVSSKGDYPGAIAFLEQAIEEIESHQVARRDDVGTIHIGSFDPGRLRGVFASAELAYNSMKGQYDIPPAIQRAYDRLMELQRELFPESGEASLDKAAALGPEIYDKGDSIESAWLDKEAKRMSKERQR